MAYENKLNSGAAFKNDKKGNEKAPDYKGNCNIDGKEKEMAIWVKEGKKGKFFSFSFSDPFTKNESSRTVENLNDKDLPF